MFHMVQAIAVNDRVMPTRNPMISHDHVLPTENDRQQLHELFDLWTYQCSWWSNGSLKKHQRVRHSLVIKICFHITYIYMYITSQVWSDDLTVVKDCHKNILISHIQMPAV